MTAETLPKIDSNGALKTRRVIPVRSKRSALRASEDRAAYLFLAPWFAGLAGITLLPMLASLYLSFTDYKVLSAPHWVGIENYFQLFTRPPLHQVDLGHSYLCRLVGAADP